MFIPDGAFNSSSCLFFFGKRDIFFNRHLFLCYERTLPEVLHFSGLTGTCHSFSGRKLSGPTLIQLCRTVGMGVGDVFLLEVQYSILKSLISTCVLSYVGSREDWLLDRICES